MFNAYVDEAHQEGRNCWQIWYMLNKYVISQFVRLEYEVNIANYNVTGTRYGVTCISKSRKMEVSQHSKYFCSYVGKYVTRVSVFWSVILQAIFMYCHQY